MGRDDERKKSGHFELDPLAVLAARVAAIESAIESSVEDAKSRPPLDESVGKLLDGLSDTVKAHTAEMREFKQATQQIARIAQVLEGAFGQSGLVAQVNGVRAEVSSVAGAVATMRAEVAELKGRVEAATEVDAALTRKPDGMGSTIKDGVISALVKVIIALSLLLGAGAIGSKLSSAPPTPPSPAAAPTSSPAP